MSGGGGGIIIRNRIAEAVDCGSVKDQLGPIKQAKLEALLSQNPQDWTLAQALFVLRCIRDAIEAYDE